jgi:hypothetical protein
MKKAIVMLLAFAVIGGFVFAQDDVVPRSTGLTIAGSATVTWGANFNTGNATGFKNESSIEIKFPLIDQGTSTHGGDPITGEITLKDLAFALDGDAAAFIDASAGVEAKIKFPNALYMTVFGAPGFELNNAKPFAPWCNDKFGDTTYGKSLVIPNLTFARANGGVAIGMTGDFSFAVKIASDGDWTNNVDQDYALGADVGYTVKDLLSASAGVSYGPTNAAPAAGFTVKVTVNPKDSGLTAVLALDGLNVGTVTGIDAMASVDYVLAKVVSVGAGVYYGDVNTTAAGARLDARVRAGLLAVENLVAEVGVDAWDVMANPALNPMWIFVGGKVNYTSKIDDANYVKPYAEFSYALNDANLALKAGVEAKLFPRTVLDGHYEAGTNANNVVTDTGANAFDDDLGRFLVSAKVTY